VHQYYLLPNATFLSASRLSTYWHPQCSDLGYLSGAGHLPPCGGLPCPQRLQLVGLAGVMADTHHRPGQVVRRQSPGCPPRGGVSIPRWESQAWGPPGCVCVCGWWSDVGGGGLVVCCCAWLPSARGLSGCLPLDSSIDSVVACRRLVLLRGGWPETPVLIHGDSYSYALPRGTYLSDVLAPRRLCPVLFGEAISAQLTLLSCSVLLLSACVVPFLSEDWRSSVTQSNHPLPAILKSMVASQGPPSGTVFCYLMPQSKSKVDGWPVEDGARGLISGARCYSMRVSQRGPFCRNQSAPSLFFSYFFCAVKQHPKQGSASQK